MGWGGRWEGGLGWGTHVNPWLIHVTEWQKPLQYFKVINFQLIKINEKKKKETFSPVVTKHYKGSMYWIWMWKNSGQRWWQHH